MPVQENPFIFKSNSDHLGIFTISLPCLLTRGYNAPLVKLIRLNQGLREITYLEKRDISPL
jgi:hypothetical protein